MKKIIIVTFVTVVIMATACQKDVSVPSVKHSDTKLMLGNSGHGYTGGTGTSDSTTIRR